MKKNSNMCVVLFLLPEMYCSYYQKFAVILSLTARNCVMKGTRVPVWHRGPRFEGVDRLHILTRWCIFFSESSSPQNRECARVMKKIRWKDSCWFVGLSKSLESYQGNYCQPQEWLSCVTSGALRFTFAISSLFLYCALSGTEQLQCMLSRALLVTLF